MYFFVKLLFFFVFLFSLFLFNNFVYFCFFCLMFVDNFEKNFWIWYFKSYFVLSNIFFFFIVEVVRIFFVICIGFFFLLVFCSMLNFCIRYCLIFWGNFILLCFFWRVYFICNYEEVVRDFVFVVVVLF